MRTRVSPLALLLTVCVVGLSAPSRAQTPAGALTPAQIRAKSGIALPSAKLPQGTVLVRVLAGPRFDRVIRVNIGLFEADKIDERRLPDFGQAIAHNAARGGAFFNAALFVGARVRVAVAENGRIHYSEPFVVPRSGGVQLVMVIGAGQPGPRAGGPGGGPPPRSPGASRLPPGHPAIGRSPTGPGGAESKVVTTSDTRKLAVFVSFQILWIESDAVVVSLAYRTFNRDGKRRFAAGRHGLFLPLPPGLKRMSVRHGPKRNISQLERGLRVRGVNLDPRASMLIVITGELPVDGPRLDVNLNSAVPLLGIELRMNRYPRAQVQSEFVTEPEQVWSPDGSTRQLIYRSRLDAFPRNAVKISIVGLPTRSRTRGVVLSAAGLLLVLVGLFGAFYLGGSRRSGGGGRRLRGDDRDPIEADVDRLVALRADELCGRIHPELGRRERGRILGDAGEVVGEVPSERGAT